MYILSLTLYYSDNFLSAISSSSLVRYFLSFILRFSSLFILLIMSTSTSSLEREIDNYPNVSFGSGGDSYESSEGSTS